MTVRSLVTVLTRELRRELSERLGAAAAEPASRAALRTADERILMLRRDELRKEIEVKQRSGR